MPKMKTKSCTKKRFKVTATGLVMVQGMGKRHNLRKRPQKMKRQARGMKVLAKPDARKVVQYYLPND